MKREFLTDLGLEKEQVDSIMKEHGKSLNALQDEKETAEKKAGEVDDLKQQIKDRDKQLEDLGKKAQGNEELTKEIDQLKEKNEQTEKDLQAKLDKQAFDFALEKAITNEKARNPKAVKALLDADSIKLDGDKLLGLDEQLKGLKESDPYLFGEENKLGGRQPHPSNPNGNPAPQNNPFSKEHRNLTEQGKFVRDDPEKAKQLIKQAGGNPANYGL